MPRRMRFPDTAIQQPPLRGKDSKGKDGGMAISQWAAEERPRERLLASGAGALSDAELVAVLLRSGVRGKSAVDLARELLARVGGIARLLSAGTELTQVSGLGPAKSAQFSAA